jgi:DNA polymerase III subunit delta
MGALTFDALLRSLKQHAPDPVYYLHGEEDVLKDEAVRALLERAVDPAARDFNVDQRAAADLDPEAFNALVNTPPMLTATRAVVLRGMEQLRKTAKVRQELLRYVDSPNPTTVLVLVHGTAESPDAELVRRATAVEVTALPPERVERWMTHRAKQLGFTLTSDAGELLLASVGADLSGLARELEKLAPLCAGRPATRDEVAALVGVRRGETVQDFVDAALERRAPAAAGLVEPVLEQAGMSGVRMLSALGTSLVGTALARAELDRDARRGGGARGDRLEGVLLSHLRAARPYGLGSWEQTARHWARWAELWTAGELRDALRLTADADRALKSSTLTDETGILEQLVLSWGVRAKEAA